MRPKQVRPYQTRTYCTESFLAAVVTILLAAISTFASPTATDLKNKKGFVWRSSETAHLRLYFEPGSFAETRIEFLRQYQEKSFARNLALLKIDEPSYKTDIFIVESRERMKQLIGGAWNGVAYPSSRVVCFVMSKSIDASGSHELMHVMVTEAFGKPSAPWINEGFAGYADDLWYGYKLHDLNKYLLVNGKLIRLGKLIAAFRKQPDMIRYPQAGSFVKFIYERYGVETVKRMWKRSDVKDIERLLGKRLDVIEKEWHAVLMEADASKVVYTVGEK